LPSVPAVRPGLQLLSPDKVAIDIRKLLYSNETAINIQIHPLDIISVNKADIVYVTGRGVSRPGGFILEDRDNVTVLQALAMAQGLGPDAAKHDARIIHQKSDGSRSEIPVDLDKVIKGQAPDPVLAANDILFVPDSVQRRVLKRALESTLATVSGLVVWGRI
jgi:polysaccharide biosynthesis/export protein